MNTTLAHLDPIGLEELTELAALQTRVDRKYIVARDVVDLIMMDLDSGTRMLEINGTRSFQYESIYFDTAQLASYLSAAHGRRHRFKVRTRTYLDSADCYLEVKTRGARSSTVKERIEHDVSKAHELDANALDYAAEMLTGIDVQVRELVPIMRTNYHRSTLYLPASNSRATIDHELAWRLEGGRSLELPTMAIIETKSGSTPSSVDRLLWRHGHRPATISKFATGMAALVPSLPSNKWARVLRTHFAPPASQSQGL